MTKLGQALQENRSAKAAEIAVVFLAAFVVIAVGIKMVGTDMLARQAVLWFANIIMLVIVWTGLRLRGQTWAHFGLELPVRRMAAADPHGAAVDPGSDRGVGRFRGRCGADGNRCPGVYQRRCTLRSRRPT